MALEERGRRITLKADISQLKSAFSKVNAIARESATELRKIGTALRFDPHSTSLLIQKQKELNREIAQNYKLIGNLKKQIAKHAELGETRTVQKLTNQLEVLRSKNETLKSSLREINKVLSNLGNIQALEKLENELKRSKTNVESLNKALKLDVGNVSAAASKFRELKSQVDNLDKQTLILVQDLRKIDFKTDPQGFNRIKAKLEETKAEAKNVRNELDKLGGAKFNQTLVQIEKLDSELKKSRETSKSLKKELEFAPNNSVLKSLKLEEARNELTKTREKTKLLKTDLDRVKTTNNREEFTRLNLKIAESNRHVKELHKSVGLINSAKLSGFSGFFSSFNQSLQSNAQAMRDAGRNFTLGYTLPVTYGMSRVLNEFRETDDGLRRVAAAASDGVREKFTSSFKEVEASARESSKGTVYSVKQVASGMEELIKANWSSADAQREVINVMNLAKVEGMELAQATEIVADGLASFGLKANETARFTDVLTMASIKSTTDITKMGETLKYVAPVAGTLGYTIEDTASAIAIMANNGIKASVAGTALRAGLTNLVKPSAQAKAALSQIGFSMTDANGKTKPLIQVISELREKTKGMTEAQKAQFSATVFGKTAMSGWMAILNASDTSVNDLTNSIKNSKGATKEMADQLTSGVGGAIDRFKASVSNASYEVGKAWAPAMKSIVDSGTGVVNSLANASDGTKKFITGVVGLTAVIPPLTWAIGSAKTQFKNFGLAMTNPITASLTLGTALGTLITQLKEKYDPLIVAQRNAKESADKLGNTFGKVGEAVGEFKKRVASARSALEQIYGKDSYQHKLEELAQSVQENYRKITKAIESATAENRTLNNQEVETIKANIESINQLENERASKTESSYKKIISLSKNLNANKNIDDESYIRNFDKHVKDLGDLHKQSNDSLQQWYDQQIEINNNLPPEMRKSSEQLKAEYDKRLAKEKQSYSESMQTAIDGYSQRFGIEQNYIKDLATARQGIEEVERQHKVRSKKIWEDTNLTYQQQIAKQKEEDTRYENEKKWHYDNLNNQFSEHKAKQLGVWLSMIQDAIANGGTLTESQTKNVKSFLDTMNTLPEETRNKYREALQKAGIDVDKLGNEVANKMNEQGSQSMNQLASGINNGQSEVDSSITTVVSSITGIVGGVNLFPLGVGIMNGMGGGIANGKPNIDNPMDAITNGMVGKVANTDMSPVGRQKSQQLGQGIKSGDGHVWNAAQQTANHGRNGASSVSFWSVGGGMIGGIVAGVNGSQGSLFSRLRGIAYGALQAAKDALGINSPSRVFKRIIGYGMAEGMAVGISEKASLVTDNIRNTLSDTVKNAKQFNVGDKMKEYMNFSAVSDYSIQHNMSQNTGVIDTLNVLIGKINDLELKSNVYLDGEKVGNITYKQHEIIDRRLGYDNL
ncbi:phage tail tape measure protein [Gemella massiliensis]|uniref:phage tail tape measure protein n=1 Tax=Gemella massiliensis TaxID=1909670 RepID=UPI000931FE8C|nr:phage tail tape measure protein [Gemella massiliensis]